MSASSSNTSQHLLGEFEENICNRAQAIITERLPRCVEKLVALLESGKLKQDIGQITNGDYLNKIDDKDTLKNKLYETNPIVADLIGDVKPIMYELADAIKTLRVWILLQVPEASDGNNVRVEVQESILNELRETETQLADEHVEMVAYFLARGKIIRRIEKFPRIKDYAHFITEADEKQFLGTKLAITNLRNACLAITNMINKNLETIVGSSSSTDINGIY